MCAHLHLQSTKITISCWTAIDRRTLEITKKRCNTSKEKETATIWQSLQRYNHDKIKFHTHWVGDSQTGEQWYQRSSPTAVKILSPTSGFPAWGSRKGTGNPQETWPWGQQDLMTGLPQDWGNQRLHSSRAQTKLVCTKTQQKGPVPLLETEPYLPANVGGSPVEVWVISGCHRDEGTESRSPVRCPLV